MVSFTGFAAPALVATPATATPTTTAESASLVTTRRIGSSSS
jgi:hypothetical protein